MSQAVCCNVPAVSSSTLPCFAMTCDFNRAVKKFLSGRLIMCSRQFWNSHQRHKFLRAEETRDISKIRVSEMAFPGVFKRYFPQEFPIPSVGGAWIFSGTTQYFLNYSGTKVLSTEN